MSRERDRWRVCLHEAGHAVACRHALGRPAAAVVVEGVCGLTYAKFHRGPTGITFAVALMVACGKAAEALTDRVDPPTEAPELRPAVLPEAGELSGHDAFVEDFDTGQPDAEILGRWAWSGGVGAQAHADRRLARLCNEAAYFVNEHREEILTVARALYARGIYIPQQERGVS